jgi:hypothetical protein
MNDVFAFKFVAAGMQGQSAAECAFRLHGVRCRTSIRCQFRWPLNPQGLPLEFRRIPSQRRSRLWDQPQPLGS